MFTDVEEREELGMSVFVHINTTTIVHFVLYTLLENKTLMMGMLFRPKRCQ